ncbi:uncharacterized protein LOC144635006 [Oculina patagonica]
MVPSFLYFTFLLVTPLNAEESQLDGSRGLKRGVHARGNRVSYGNFAVDKFHRLQVSVGSSTLVSNYSACALSCVNNPPCSSFNVASSPRSDGKYRCELLNEDKYSANPGQLVSSQEYHHFSIKTPCSSFPCQNSAKCVPNYGENEYHCDCVPGYTGRYCETVLRTCQDVYEVSGSSQSQQVTLILGSTPTTVLCHIGDFGCGGGGWTPVMKMDGSKSTFHYDSAYWSNQNSYNSSAWVTGFDSQEAKIPSYWNTPFSKICLGMKIGPQTKFIVINRQANSLYSLIADGQYRPTSLGRNKWQTLIDSGGSLQVDCNKEGFNTIGSDGRYSKARIGIIANDWGDCVACDSRIGFGTGGEYDNSNTCGNEATWYADNGDKHIKAMGYIFVQ